VESTTLATVAYDDVRELLRVEFRSRAIYQYLGVLAAVHPVRQRTPSKGRYFNRPRNASASGPVHYADYIKILK
jgi:hypothetical protein